MGLAQQITTLIGSLMIELPAKRQPIAELVRALETEGDRLNVRLQSINDSTNNVQQLRHIIGIERWGQRRLRVALGETPLADEYDAYQPAADTPWPALREEFAATRNQTIDLARQLAAQGATTLVRHNMFGPISIKGWLYYLKTHAKRESMRLR